MIIVLDYGIGNLGSILNMLKKIGVEAKISADISDINAADKLILPGVGSFDNGMRNLIEKGLSATLNQKVIEEKTPILGICLGMQLFSKKSEEGQLNGLGWIEAETIRFRFNQRHSNLKIPHMGWNTVKIRKDTPLFKNMYEGAKFYFVHSYHLVCKNENDILTETYYGYNFASSVQVGNIIGVQFHPEKSHKFGMRLFKNFAEAY